MKIAVVGATGLVGTKMLEVLAERDFTVTELIPVASERSVGKIINWKGKEIKVVGLEEAVSLKPNIALFSAGGTTSKEWAPKFANNGTYVIDNSSAWRMDPNIPLVVPEVNSHHLTEDSRIIANPNCSTIQMVVALNPLNKAFGLKRVVVSTYQSVTGTGQAAVQQLMDERNGIEGEKVYPYPIDLNVLPHIDVFMENRYTKEEMKMILETKKIMGLPELKITATTVRIPTMGGHSESINCEFNSNFELSEIVSLLSSSRGITVQDDINNLEYPMPLTAHNKDEVFVGRIRRDESIENGLNIWVVSDNLRKGAATNAVQIAEILKEKPWF